MFKLPRVKSTYGHIGLLQKVPYVGLVDRFHRFDVDLYNSRQNNGILYWAQSNDEGGLGGL